MQWRGKPGHYLLNMRGRISKGDGNGVDSGQCARSLFVLLTIAVKPLALAVGSVNPAK